MNKMVKEQWDALSQALRRPTPDAAWRIIRDWVKSAAEGIYDTMSVEDKDSKALSDQRRALLRERERERN